MTRRKNLFLFLFLLAFSAVPAHAADIQSCSVDITTGSPDSIPWDQVYVTKGNDGSAWQRAILNQPETTITIREGEPITIKGTAQPGQPVQIFVYGKDPKSTAVEKPSVGVCFEVAKADPASGYFSAEIDATIFWPNIDKQIVLDAFSRLDKNWNQLQKEKTNSEFYIGTHDLPKTVGVVGDTVQSKAAEKAGRLTTTATCRPVCGKRNYIEGVFIDPANAPYQEVASAFDAVGSRAVSLARNEGGHTRYTGVDGGNGDPQALRDITYKALSLELVKQALLGTLKTDPKIPSIGTIDVATMQTAAATEGSIAANLKTIMTDSGNAPTAAAKIAKMLSQGGKTNEKFLATSLMGALPKTATEATWADQFVTTMVFWTGSTPPNSCLMLNDGLEWKNFTLKAFQESIDCRAESENKPNAEPGLLDLLPPPPPPPAQPGGAAPVEGAGDQPEADGQQPQPEAGGDVPPPPPPPPPPAAGGDPAPAPADQDMPPPPPPPPANNQAPTTSTPPVPNIPPQTPQTPGDPPDEFENVGGRSPRIVLSSLEEVQLTPAFKGVAISYAQQDFDAGKEYWTLPAGIKDIMYYRYVFTERYAGDFVGSACVKKADVNEYVKVLADKFQLNEKEQKALTAEINTGLVDEEAFYGLSIAKPADVASRFVWKNGDQILNIFRLFFTAEKGACDVTDFGNIDAERSGDDGFEAGLLI